MTYTVRIAFDLGTDLDLSEALSDPDMLHGMALFIDGGLQVGYIEQVFFVDEVINQDEPIPYYPVEDDALPGEWDDIEWESADKATDDVESFDLWAADFKAPEWLVDQHNEKQETYDVGTIVMGSNGRIYTKLGPDSWHRVKGAYDYGVRGRTLTELSAVAGTLTIVDYILGDVVA